MHFGHNNRVKMLASKSLLSSPNLSSPAVSKDYRRRLQPPYLTPMPSSNASENVSALKAKYTDYAMWLKASSRQNREPIFTHELLKHSLCQMGIDSTHAEQLVSTCTWYVYQFQKELGVETEQTNQSRTIETKKSTQSSKRRPKKIHTIKSKKTILHRENSVESATTVASTNKESCISSGVSSHRRNKFLVLPSIQPSDASSSLRPRHVDFDNEQPVRKQKSSHWRSAMTKVRILPKLRPIGNESSVNNDDDMTPESTAVDLDLSSSQKSSLRTGRAHHTRSILRKQTSTSSSVVSEVTTRRNRSRIVTPTSTVIDETPLGTKSQRLFGGSECFAEIMNELEEQDLN